MFILLAASLVLTSEGCKSKKKLAEQQRIEAQRAAEAAKQAKINQVKAELEALMATPCKDLAEVEARERKLAGYRDLNVDDAGVLTLIKKVDYFLQQERERLEKEAKAAQQAQTPAPDPAANLKFEPDRYFNEIAGTSNVSAANSRIEQALRLFASPDAAVLIVISQSGAAKDYDRPTTIRNYLNYLKDQQKNLNRVQNVTLDAAGKIREIELVRK
ncbi:MAG: hypothetical protein EAZ89_09845 [Bacteroidetes bacterium]|nr:MAG: hypothetical protein EAZ89_09845 [Bacteroidota bacterium]